MNVYDVIVHMFPYFLTNRFSNFTGCHVMAVGRICEKFDSIYQFPGFVDKYLIHPLNKIREQIPTHFKKQINFIYSLFISMCPVLPLG